MLMTAINQLELVQQIIYLIICFKSRKVKLT